MVKKFEIILKLYYNKRGNINIYISPFVYAFAQNMIRHGGRNWKFEKNPKSRYNIYRKWEKKGEQKYDA